MQQGNEKEKSESFPDFFLLSLFTAACSFHKRFSNFSIIKTCAAHFNFEKTRSLRDEAENGWDWNVALIKIFKKCTEIFFFHHTQIRRDSTHSQGFQLQTFLIISQSIKTSLSSACSYLNWTFSRGFAVKAKNGETTPPLWSMSFFKNSIRRRWRGTEVNLHRWFDGERDIRTVYFVCISFSFRNIANVAL